MVLISAWVDSMSRNAVSSGMKRPWTGAYSSTMTSVMSASRTKNTNRRQFRTPKNSSMAPANV